MPKRELEGLMYNAKLPDKKFDAKHVDYRGTDYWYKKMRTDLDRRQQRPVSRMVADVLANIVRGSR